MIPKSLQPMTEEELAEYKPVTSEEIKEALEKGRKEREEVEKYLYSNIRLPNIFFT